MRNQIRMCDACGARADVQSLQTRSTIVDRYHKRGRDYVVNETDVLSADDGRLFVRGRTHQSFLPERTGQDGDDAFVVDEK